MSIVFSDLPELDKGEHSKENEDAIKVAGELDSDREPDQNDELEGSCDFSPTNRREFVTFPMPRKTKINPK